MSRKKSCQICNGEHLTNRCFSERIVLILVQKGLTVSDVADEAKIDTSRVHNWYYKNTGIVAYDLMRLMQRYDFIRQFVMVEFDAIIASEKTISDKKITPTFFDWPVDLSLKSDTMPPMSSKNKKTLSTILVDKINSPAILWADIERLFIACGGIFAKEQGPRVRVLLNGVLAVFHHSHSKQLELEYESVRRF